MLGMVLPENVQQLNLYCLCVVPKASVGWIFFGSSSKSNSSPDNSLSTSKLSLNLTWMYLYFQNLQKFTSGNQNQDIPKEAFLETFVSILMFDIWNEVGKGEKVDLMIQLKIQ